jgi:hypothetical protein
MLTPIIDQQYVLFSELNFGFLSPFLKKIGAVFYFLLCVFNTFVFYPPSSSLCCIVYGGGCGVHCYGRGTPHGVQEAPLQMGFGQQCR